MTTTAGWTRLSAHQGGGAGCGSGGHGGEGHGGVGRGGGGRGGGGVSPEDFVSYYQLEDAEDHNDQAAEEPDFYSGDGVGGGNGGPGGGDDVEHDHGDQQLEGQSEEGLGEEEGEPGESGEDGGGQVEGEEGGSEGPAEEDLHPVHAVVPCTGTSVPLSLPDSLLTLVPHKEPPAEVELPHLRVEWDVSLRGPVVAKSSADFHQFDIVSV